MTDITAQEHAEQMLQIAEFAIGKIRVMRLNKAERATLHHLSDVLTQLKHSVNEAEDGTLKIKAA